MIETIFIVALVAGFIVYYYTISKKGDEILELNKKITAHEFKLREYQLELNETKEKFSKAVTTAVVEALKTHSGKYDKYTSEELIDILYTYNTLKSFYHIEECTYQNIVTVLDYCLACHESMELIKNALNNRGIKYDNNVKWDYLCYLPLKKLTEENANKVIDKFLKVTQKTAI